MQHTWWPIYTKQAKLMETFYQITYQEEQNFSDAGTSKFSDKDEPDFD